MSDSHADHALDEFRSLMRADWGVVTHHDGTPLANIDRAAALYGIVEDPYHHVAFDERSNVDLMRMCAYGLIEAQQWDKAARAIANVNRMEREQENDDANFALSFAKKVAASSRQAAPAPQAAPAKPVEPAETPEPKPLSDREAWLMLKELRRRRRVAALKPATAKPPAAPAREADTVPPMRAAAGESTRLPFT